MAEMSGVVYGRLRMDNNYVRAIHIAPGLKVYMPDKESCLDLENKLNRLGIKTRSGRNCEADIWSIYIISVPDELDDTSTVL